MEGFTPIDEVFQQFAESIYHGYHRLQGENIEGVVCLEEVIRRSLKHDKQKKFHERRSCC